MSGYDWRMKKKNSKVGLWSEPSPVPPWKFRHKKRSVEYRKSVAPIKSLSSYHGNTTSKVFHSSNCRHFNCKNCTAVFNSRNEAINTGYRACKGCMPYESSFKFIKHMVKNKDKKNKLKYKFKDYEKDKREILKFVPKLRKVKKGSK